MKKTGIFYGSSTGTTASVAEKIAKELNVASSDVHDVASTAPSALGDYDVVLLGTSTWGDGEMQDSWMDFIDGAEMLALNGKYYAVFGCGDETMADSFCSGMGKLYKRFERTGAKAVGQFNADGYTFNHSDAMVDGSMVGLVLDEVNHADMTDVRIKEWISVVKKDIE